MSDLYRLLMWERFGSVAEMERERRQSPPVEVARRRRVLHHGTRP